MTSWNLLHGMTIPPQRPEMREIKISEAIATLGSDVIALQEIDHGLPRSANREQIQETGFPYWVFAPTIFGTPGEIWRPLQGDEVKVISHDTIHQAGGNLFGSYGVAIASHIPITRFERLELGTAPIGLPLLIPNERGQTRFFYVKDEPRVAVAAFLENKFIVINTHLSFVPVFNAFQLRKIKKWAHQLENESGYTPIILGDLNQPWLRSGRVWRSLIAMKSYPSWGAKIQFDYILTKKQSPLVSKTISHKPTGLSDHLPISVEIE